MDRGRPSNVVEDMQNDKVGNALWGIMEACANYKMGGSKRQDLATYCDICKCAVFCVKTYDRLLDRDNLRKIRLSDKHVLKVEGKPVYGNCHSCGTSSQLYTDKFLCEECALKQRVFEAIKEGAKKRCKNKDYSGFVASISNVVLGASQENMF